MNDCSVRAGHLFERSGCIMEILKKYLDRTEFSSYEDFKKNFRINVPGDFDYARDIVDARADAEPDSLALMYCSDDGKEIPFSFADISELSKRAASYLKEMGIGKRDRVMTLLRRRYEYWIIAIALHRLGAIIVPASIQLTQKDISYRINSAGVKALIALNDDFVNKQISDIKSLCPGLESIIYVGDEKKEGYAFFSSEYLKCDMLEGYSGLSNDDEMIIYFTSGTSGYPKMAIHDRLYPLGHIVTAGYMQRVKKGRLHLTLADSGWAKFGWGNIYGQWICGAPVLGYDPVRFSSEHLLTIIKKYSPASMCVPPTMYRLLLRDGLDAEHVKSVEWFSTAGEPLAGEINNEFRRITGKYIHEGFGQSEGTPITCGFEWLEIRPSSMGKPSPLYDVAIISPDGSRCRPGQHGEVVIFVGNDSDRKGRVGLLRAYFSDGKYINPTRDGIYHTGDIAYEDEDGYYWYVGRNDDMIKSSGYRIGPFEIESVLNTHPAVKESAIVGCPDPIRGQIICGVIALSSDYKPSDSLTKELQDYVKANTAPYKYPRKIVYTAELPKTTSGKIIRKDLLSRIS